MTLKTQVSCLDVALPEGFPRSAFTIIGGESGVGKSVFLIELAWRALERGENVVYVSLEESPGGLIARFLSLGWDPSPYLKKKQMLIYDGLSYLLDSIPAFSKFKSFFDLEEEMRKSVIKIDPSHPTQLQESLFRKMETIKSQNKECLIVLDNLTELYSLGARKFSMLMKNLRAVSAALSFPIICSAHFGVVEKFPANIAYLADGIIDLRFHPGFMDQGILVKQMRVRRMSGVRSLPIWLSFSVERGQGLTLAFDYVQKVQQEMTDTLKKLGIEIDIQLPKKPDTQEEVISED